MIILNGEECDLSAGESILAALARLEIAGDARGIAVAVDGEVVPRTHWGAYALDERAHVEVLTAMQGG